LGKNNGFILLKKSNNLRKISYLGRKIRLFLIFGKPRLFEKCIKRTKKNIFEFFIGLFYCEKNGI
jgi:hypothetical protein